MRERIQPSGDGVVREVHRDEDQGRDAPSRARGPDKLRHKDAEPEGAECAQPDGSHGDERPRGVGGVAGGHRPCDAEGHAERDGDEHGDEPDGPVPQVGGAGPACRQDVLKGVALLRSPHQPRPLQRGVQRQEPGHEHHVVEGQVPAQGLEVLRRPAQHPHGLGCGGDTRGESLRSTGKRGHLLMQGQAHEQHRGGTPDDPRDCADPVLSHRVDDDGHARHPVMAQAGTQRGTPPPARTPGCRARVLRGRLST